MSCKEKQITIQGNFVKFSIIIILLFISQLVLSQKVESVYMSEFDSGITIYTITNRTYEQSGEDIQFFNDVSSDTVLTFLKI